jgi:predicted signal transduction protein with EAL and GGDEF domain
LVIACRPVQRGRAGITIYPANGGDVATLVKNSSLALDSAPEAPDFSFAFYSADANTMAREHLAIGQKLRRAIEREELALQPIVDLRERRLVGLEALFRWTNETLGPVSPDKFIPIAEDTGLIGPIGD